MKEVVKLLALSIMAIAAGTAMAEPGKWYVGAGAGQSMYNDWPSKGDISNVMDEFGSRLGIVRFDGEQSAGSEDTDLGYKVFGGYSLHKYIALELAYLNMGEADADARKSGTFYDLIDNSLDGDLFINAKAEVEAFTLDVNLNYPILSFAAVIAKVGMYSADTKLKINAGSSISAENFNHSKTEGSTGLHYGFGFNFTLTDAIALRTEWERLEEVGANDGEADVDLLSAALIYNF